MSPMNVQYKNISRRRLLAAFSKLCCYLLLMVWFAPVLQAQSNKRRISLKDSLDGGFDLSDYIIQANGFVPIPYFITEPALGGFGGALIPVFIKKNAGYVDSVNGELKITPVAPDITGGLGLYTLNNSWALAAFRSGIFVKKRIKYTVGTAYADINMSFYKTFDQLGEKKLAFNIKILPLLLQGTKRIGLSHWYAGIKYFFLQAKARYVGDTTLLNLAKSLESTKIISQLGGIIELDNRDNIFTPYKGIKFHVDAVCADNMFGSDYDYWRINYYTYLYKMLFPRITAGLRVDGQQIFGSAPFYMQPYIEMRGIPIYRYQGNANVLSELELRWDFTRRWSAMLFSGTGKAMESWDDFGSEDWLYSYGTGVRYLLARKFKLRVGIDVAHGADTWAYYIVFGSNWVK